MDTSKKDLPSNVDMSYRLSMVAYLVQIIFGLFWVFVAFYVGAAFSKFLGGSFYAEPYLVILAVTYTVCKLAYLASTKLFCDGEGVWMSVGIFPWDSGVRGVRWENFDEAVYAQGIVSWLFKSYNVKVTHRFSKKLIINMRHVARGDVATLTINSCYLAYVKNRVDMP